MKIRKGFLLLLCVILLLAGCNQPAQQTEPVDTTPTTEPTSATEPQALVFPQDVTILGVDVSGMNMEQAITAVNTALGNYALQVTINGQSFQITGLDVEMQIPANKLESYAQALAEGRINPTAPQPELNSTLLRQRIAAGSNSAVKDASISYSSSADSFVISKERSGVSVDLYAAAKQIEPAMLAMEESCSLTVEEVFSEPTVLSNDTRLLSAQTKANAYLEVKLSYIYAPEKVEAKTQALSKDDIGKMVRFSSSYEPYLDMTAIENYAVKMDDKYCVRDKFNTSFGSSVNVNMGEVLQSVNIPELASDIKTCLENKTSGTRNAPYWPRVEPTGKPSETYVEVSLTAQHLWVYKNGQCVVSTPIVSGCVNNRTTTITGVYSIYAKTQNVTLSGPGYASPVKYWMPFSGGYGLHDADWRSSFGGDIYLYDGSHGCVNIPPSVAGQVYNNVSIGTKVIIYGGATDLKHKPQLFTGTTEYTVLPNAAPFKLDLTATGPGPLSYVSDNPAVVQVAADGTVTIKGEGNAKITVTSPAGNNYDEATTTVTIKVHCDHSYTWEVTKEATCVPGEETGTCVCGKQQTRPVEPVKDHACDSWQTVTEPGCETEGKQIGTCTGCGTELTQMIPATGHDFTTGDTCGNGCGATKSTTPEPENPTPPDPDDSTTPDPDDSTTPDPDDSTTPDPDDSTTPTPDDSTTPTTDDSTTPDDSTDPAQ